MNLIRDRVLLSPFLHLGSELDHCILLLTRGEDLAGGGVFLELDPVIVIVYAAVSVAVIVDQDYVLSAGVVGVAVRWVAVGVSSGSLLGYVLSVYVVYVAVTVAVYAAFQEAVFIYVFPYYGVGYPFGQAVTISVLKNVDYAWLIRVSSSNFRVSPVSGSICRLPSPSASHTRVATWGLKESM